jgi:hypothetical protein
MKKVLIFTMVGLLMTFSKVMAQEEGKFRVGLDMGLPVPNSGGVRVSCFTLSPSTILRTI